MGILLGREHGTSPRVIEASAGRLSVREDAVTGTADVGRMTTRGACILLGLVAAGCASHASDTVAERELFRIAAAEVLEAPTAAGAVAQPEGPPVEAFAVELRFTRLDGASTGPSRITMLPGRGGAMSVTSQLTFIQDFDVETADGAFIADPIIGSLLEGWNVRLFVQPLDGREAEVALAYAADAANVRRPIPVRRAGPVSPEIDLPVSIQVPRVGHASARGARVASLGVWEEVARLIDPSIGSDIELSARVERVLVPRPSVADAGVVVDDSALVALARAVAPTAGTPSLRVSAVRLPPGVHDPDARGVDRLATLALRSTLVPGVRVSDRLGESYLGDWEAKTFEGGVAFDPEIRTHDSGLSVEVASATEVVVSWRTTPRWEIFTLRPFSSVGVGSITNAPPAGPEDFELTIDQPQSLATERRITLAPGRSVHEVFRLADGGAAALVVEYQP